MAELLPSGHMDRPAPALTKDSGWADRVRKGLRFVYAGALVLVLSVVVTGATQLVIMRTDPIFSFNDSEQHVYSWASLLGWVMLDEGDAGPAARAAWARRPGMVGVIVGACWLSFGRAIRIRSDDLLAAGSKGDIADRDVQVP